MKAVLDIGKTNVKLQLVNDLGQLCGSYTFKNLPCNVAPYPHADVAGIWQWLMATLASYEQVNQITAVVVTTHGATAALIHNDPVYADGLVLPVLDYEFSGINECDSFYNTVRPHFSETLSPELPAGLNLGRQIYWLQRTFPTEFSRATNILMYPQYWGWRLTGQLATEVTSLGCHTDLWSPETNRYSTLVKKCHWQELMPPVKPAWDELGRITLEIAEKTGLPANCKVYVGLHDSNASYLRYLYNNQSSHDSFTVISTGTWTILMRARGELAVLNRTRDTLANCDVYGDPIACSRFMGGREYDVICQHLGGNIDAAISTIDVQTAVDNFWMVTPDFSNGNGPFGGLKPIISCPLPAVSAGAIATLYCALMIDQRLTDLHASGPIYIEGAFLKNTLLCQLVAQLRSEQPVYLSADDTGTVQGALLLASLPANNKTSPSHLELESCAPSHVWGLAEYRARWQALITQANVNK